MVMSARVVTRHASAGRMNGTEAQYAARLRAQQLAGDVFWWRYEPVTLRLAPRTTYTPDFMVVLMDGRVELHEVKGFWRDDARVKFKVAANAFPFFGFVAAQRDKRSPGEWRIERLNDEGATQ